MTHRPLTTIFPLILLAGTVALSNARPPAVEDADGGRVSSQPSTDLDQDRSVVWFGGLGLDGNAIEGGTWDFTDGTTQGWTSSVPFSGLTRRVTTSDFLGDPVSPMFPAPSTAQIWCGVHEAEADGMGYTTGMGYGNSWCLEAQSPHYPISSGNSVSIVFMYQTDSEEGYDSTTVNVVTYDADGIQLEKYRVAMFTGLNGTPTLPATFSQTVPYSSFSPAPFSVALEFDFASDASFSDEDGDYDSTYGAFSVDDVAFTIGTVPHPFNFESGLQGWTMGACFSPAPLMGVAGSSTYADWLAASGITSCTLSGNALEDVSDTGSPPGRPDPLWETLSSPVISRGGHIGSAYNTTILRYDLYWNFPRKTGTFLRIAHRYYDSETGWSEVRPYSGTWWYLGTPQCKSYAYNFSSGPNPAPADWESLRVVIDVATDCEAFGVGPNCTEPGGTKGSPIFDNVRVGLTGSSARVCCQQPGNVCGLLTEGECLGLGGVWYGDMSSCTPNPCGMSAIIEPDGSGAYPTIQAGVNASYDGDTLILGDGVFRGSGNRDIDTQGKGIVVRSELNDPTICVIDGEGMGRGFHFGAGEDSFTVLQGVTVRNGSAEYGGGVHVFGCAPKIVDCIFTYNETTSAGGGAYCSGPTSAPIFRRCIFSINEAGLEGGGLRADGGAQPRISRCTFDHNVARGAGATLATGGAGVALIDHSILSFGVGAAAVSCTGAGDVPLMSCCDVFGNEGGDYVDCIAGQLGVNNNFTADPLFCAEGNPLGPYAVSEDSQCAAENNPECGVVGVRGLGCAVLTVDPEGGGEYPTIQGAADAATPGDVVLLEAGTYIERSSTGISMRGKPIIIRSQSRGRQGATIDCQGSKRGFIFDTGEGPGSMLDGLRIVNGRELFGGAVLCSTGTSPTLHECLFTSNRADSLGGAICCWGGSAPFIADCTFQSDTAAAGGGIALMGDAAPRIDRCKFLTSVAQKGGGVLVAGSASPALWHCTLDGNIADEGGGVYCETDARPLLRYCTIVRNDAASGGGIYSAGSLGNVENTIIAFSARGAAVAGSALRLACSDLFGNPGGNWAGPIGGQSGWEGNFSLDPLFCDLQNGDYQIWNSSPCNIVSCAPVGAWPPGCFVTVAVDPNPASESMALADFSATSSPNPFVEGTTIRYVIPAASGPRRVQVRIFDVAGRLLRTLFDAPQPPGRYSLAWDGKRGTGEDLPSGAYFCRVQIGDWEAVRTALHVR